MRKIVAGLFISLDGVTEAPDQWHFPYFNDEMGQAVGANMERSDALLLGRVTFDAFAGYWPDKSAADDPFADYINNVPKYVVSNTLQHVDWPGTSLISGDVAGQIRELKEQPGKDIAMSGSVATVRWLLSEGLLDELDLLVHPIVVGEGATLFPDGTGQLPLQLLHSATFSTGVVHLTYAPAEE
ncbi:MAG: dihydrofolate reductase family protein [Actinomycetota bacterium]